MNGKEVQRKFGFCICCFIIYVIGYPFVERISFQIPDVGELKTVTGTIEFKETWKDGNRLVVHAPDGKHVFTCRVTDGWLIPNCPLDKNVRAEIAGKQVTVLWHKQTLWPLTSRENLVYAVSLAEGNIPILPLQKMVDFYKDQRSYFFSLLVLLFDAWLARYWVRENRKLRLKNNQKESEKMRAEIGGQTTFLR